MTGFGFFALDSWVCVNVFRNLGLDSQVCSPWFWITGLDCRVRLTWVAFLNLGSRVWIRVWGMGSEPTQAFGYLLHLQYDVQASIYQEEDGISRLSKEAEAQDWPCSKKNWAMSVDADACFYNLWVEHREMYFVIEISWPIVAPRPCRREHACVLGRLPNTAILALAAKGRVFLLRQRHRQIHDCYQWLRGGRANPSSHPSTRLESKDCWIVVLSAFLPPFAHRHQSM